MGRKINLIVNYKNCLGLWHIAAEQMTVTTKNYFIKPADFAEWIAEIYMKRGCDHVICIEFLQDKITKAGLKDLAETDEKFLTEMVKDKLGQRWEFKDGDKDGEQT